MNVGHGALQPVYGLLIGIIVLDTGFERLPGDIAHTAAWPFPVQFRVVRGVSPADVISGDPRTSLAAFYAAIARQVLLPVYDIVTLIRWMHSALAPARYTL